MLIAIRKQRQSRMSKKTPPWASQMPEPRNHSNSIETAPTTPIQFDWRKHWDKKVKPHLHNPFVEFALDLGLNMAEPTWNPGDPPYRAGRDWPRRPREGRAVLVSAWRQVSRNLILCDGDRRDQYPELDWKFISGRFHTVVVGYDHRGHAQVVLDILWFDESTAEESIEFAQGMREHAAWQRTFAFFETDVAAAVREAFAQNYSAENCKRL